MYGEYDWFSPNAISEYFRQLHSRTNNFDKAQIKDILYKEELFETAAKSFKLIDDNTTSVIVNWEEKNIMSLINQLQTEGFSYSLMKKLSQFSVNVRNNDLRKLEEAGAIEEIIEGVRFIRDSHFYDNEVGLKTDNHWLEEPLII